MCWFLSLDHLLGYRLCKMPEQFLQEKPESSTWLFNKVVTSYNKEHRRHYYVHFTNSIFQNLTAPWIVKIYPAFYGPLWSITMFTTASQSQMNPVHTLSSYFLHIHFNNILPYTHSCSKWLLPSGFLTKTLYAFLLTPMQAGTLYCLYKMYPCSMTPYNCKIGMKPTTWSSMSLTQML